MPMLSPTLLSTDNNNSPPGAPASRVEAIQGNEHLPKVLDDAHNALSSLTGAPFTGTQSSIDQTSLNLQSTLHHLSEVSKNLKRSNATLASLLTEIRNAQEFLPPSWPA
ncbi:hypothetical protein BGZ81_006678 [Podila clonocystis]|nr:hypothetical protein BGZ81_006678 [Podila clonocystis]